MLLGPMHAIALPPGVQVLVHDWLSSNTVVLFDDAESASVVDTGHLARARRTCEGVRGALAGRRLRRIVNTHLHSDHCGGNAALQREHGGPQQCTIVVPAGELQAVNDWDESGLSFVQAGQQAESFAAAASYADGQVLQLGGLRWQAHAAPGHDAHALMLFQPDSRLLITGDALWEYGFGVLFCEFDTGDGFAAQRRTLQRMAELQPALVVPGHGAVFGDAQAALRRAGERLEMFERDPRRHVAHALRVLLKFHLLEQGSMLPLPRVRQWFEGAELVARIVRRQLPAQSVAAAFDSTLDDLCRAGAAVLRDGRVGDPEVDAAARADTP